MKVIQIGEILLNVNNISNINIVPHPSGANGYVVRIITIVTMKKLLTEQTLTSSTSLKTK